MSNFIPVDSIEEDAEFLHINPSVIAHVSIQNSTEGDTKKFPYEVVAYMLNHEEIGYKFKTIGEAKQFIRKIGGLA